MADFRRLSDTVQVAPQVALSDIGEAAALGVTTIVSNRPDGEDPGQPTAAEVAEAARAAGVAFVHAPVSGFPDEAAIHAVGEVLAKGEPVWMFCRSGTRSAVTWALAMRRAGADADALREAGARAGYDLSRLPL
ncbi:TIGR01244 family sulfur transferase [Brevundimonas bacteroides]|uniref:TIGR01244 family sulfur transferase n=1 Tax=Brevundimonas bacteroides TaxID=74311 RepID=UPI0004950246|nr:TIGR01244 family sulfur transferase [Brevundimonas bacteroides]